MNNKEKEKKLNIQLNKKYLKISINHFTLLNKILLNLSEQSSKILDKTTDEGLKETIISNCNNTFQLMSDFENVIKLSEEAYIDFSKKERI